MELFSQVETQLMDEVNNLTESYMEQAMNGGEVPDRKPYIGNLQLCTRI